MPLLARHQLLARGPATVRDPRGFTLIEALVVVGMMGILSLAIGVMFNLSIKSSLRTRRATYYLSSARKAIHGDGATRGMLLETLYASSATASGATSLALSSPGGITTFSLSSTNLQRISGATTILSPYLTNLQVFYYAYSSTSGIQAISTPGDARLITYSLQTSLIPNATFYTGGVLYNHL